MRNINSTFTGEINKKENQPIRLYTIWDYNGIGTNLNYAEYDIDVTFDGITYSAFPIKFDSVSENNRGTIDQVKITVGNVSRLIQSYLEDYDFRGKKVTIKTVFANQLSDPSACLNDTYYIDQYSADQHSVVFALSSKFDVLDVKLPLRLYTRNYCGFVFKSTQCGYSGSETSCNKTKQRCKALDNYVRFGGFPSIKPNRVALI